MAMRKSPTRGDWATFANELLVQYEIDLNLETIKYMKKSQFKNLVKKQIQKIAFRDLINKKKLW